MEGYRRKRHEGQVMKDYLMVIYKGQGMQGYLRSCEGRLSEVTLWKVIEGQVIKGCIMSRNGRLSEVTS